MKIKITLKDPDGFYESITQAVAKEINNIDDLSRDEKDDLIETRRVEAEDMLSEWVEYNEYITIEFDTEAGTATVLPQ